MNEYQIGLLLAAASALTFTILSLWARGMQMQEGPIRYVCFMSIIPAIISLASWTIWPPQWHWPVIQAALLLTPLQFLGSFALGTAYVKGEVSHVTPIFGSKPLIVTMMAGMLALEPATPNLWLASIVVFIAFYLLSGKREVILRPWLVLQPVVLLVIISCACYGISDLVSKHYVRSQGVGIWEFLTINWVVRGAVLAVFLLVYSHRRRESMLPRKWTLALLAGPVIIGHALAFVLALKLTDSAIVVNILSSLRGLISVLLILSLGLLKMGNYERMTRPVLIGRLAGSLLVCLAIYLALGFGKTAENPPAGPAAVTAPPALLPAGNSPTP